MQEVDDGLVEAVARLEAVAGADDVADDDVDTGCGGAHVDRGRGLELAEAVVMGGVLPLLLGKAGVLFGLLEDGVVDGFDGLGGVDAGGNVDGDLVPHPLAGGGEVEVLAGDGEVVDEGDAAAGGMALVGPVAGFEQGGAEEADLDDLAADAVDLDPVADADAVFAHEDEPAEEGEDEVLKDDGEAGGAEAEDGGDLVGRAEDDEEHEAKRDESECRGW